MLRLTPPATHRTPGRHPSNRAAAALAALLTLPLITGCSRIFTASGVRFQSIDRGTILAPAIASSGYRTPDTSTAEFYLSDIPLRDLAQAESFEELNGTIVHIHLFIRPRPGKTPIETTASSATIQAVVLSRGEVGLYGGGGFMLPAGTPGDDTLGGSIQDGSVRLLAATPGFADRLGAVNFSAGLSAPKDEGAAGVMAHILEQAIRLAKPDPTGG
ncbi:MAG: hypothetical protein IT431_08090 [Phycisphaerales bacterium]|nr:hypothetical protein [Phycisphaerales bacterium]